MKRKIVVCGIFVICFAVLMPLAVSADSLYDDNSSMTEYWWTPSYTINFNTNNYSTISTSIGGTRYNSGVLSELVNRGYYGFGSYTLPGNSGQLNDVMQTTTSNINAGGTRYQAVTYTQLGGIKFDTNVNNTSKPSYYDNYGSYFNVNIMPFITAPTVNRAESYGIDIVLNSPFVLTRNQASSLLWKVNFGGSSAPVGQQETMSISYDATYFTQTDTSATGVPVVKTRAYGNRYTTTISNDHYARFNAGQYVKAGPEQGINDPFRYYDYVVISNFRIKIETDTSYGYDTVQFRLPLFPSDFVQPMTTDQPAHGSGSVNSFLMGISGKPWIVAANAGDSVSVLGWIGETLSNVFDIPLFGSSFTLGGLLTAMLGLGFLIMIIKFFAGG